MAKAATQYKTSETTENGSLQGRLNRQIGQARERMSDSLSGARERLGDFQASASDLWDDTVDYVRENPGKVIAFSLGVGLAIGLALRFGRTEYFTEFYAKGEEE